MLQPNSGFQVLTIDVGRRLAALCGLFRQPAKTLAGPLRLGHPFLLRRAFESHQPGGVVTRHRQFVAHRIDQIDVARLIRFVVLKQLFELILALDNIAGTYPRLGLGKRQSLTFFGCLRRQGIERLAIMQHRVLPLFGCRGGLSGLDVPADPIQFDPALARPKMPCDRGGGDQYPQDRLSATECHWITR